MSECVCVCVCVLYLDLHGERGDAGVLGSPYDHLLEKVPLVMRAHGTVLGRVLGNRLVRGERKRGGGTRGAAERARHQSRDRATHLRDTNTAKRQQKSRQSRTTE